jgi:hypothetical protein
MTRILIVFFASVLPLFSPGASSQQTLDKFQVKRYEESGNPHISKHAYILAASVWRDSRVIFVCWENPSDQFSAEMQTVRQAVDETWHAASQLEFSGWQACAPKNAGIHIRIDDSGPHTKGLGRQINGVTAGMVLNFTFQNWSPDCQKTYQYCVYSIAVHEFGHAIGFAHEQNSPRAPGECRVMRQGRNGDLLLTLYDPQSVMNYCNQRYNNDGRLSPLDKSAVQELYGAR